MGIAFDKAHGGQMKAPAWMEHTADGRVIIRAVAHTTLTAGTLYRVIWDEYGPLTKAIATDADSYRVGVAKAATVTGGIAELIHGGPTTVTNGSLSVAVGHYLGITAGNIVDGGCDFDDLLGSAFAVCYTATSSETTTDVIMVPEIITAVSG